jgi:hypothetical protein
VRGWGFMREGRVICLASCVFCLKILSGLGVRPPERSLQNAVPTVDNHDAATLAT